MKSPPNTVNPLGRARAPRRPRRAQSSGPRKYNLGIAHVILVVLASLASRATASSTTLKSLATSGITNMHTCAIMDDDSLMCWGDNDQGALGLRTDDTKATSPVGPVDLGTGRTAKAVYVESGYTCAILDDDTVKCWGSNSHSRLGYGDTTTRYAPDATEVANLGAGRTAKALALAPDHACAILDDDTVKCWGYGTYGRLGYGDETPRTAAAATAVVDLGSGRTAKAISAGYYHTCAILDDDKLKCWGRNRYGSLGLGHTAVRGDGAGEMGDSLPYVNLGAGRTAKAVSAGEFNTCAILDNDSLKCWGNNLAGKLGYGDTNDRGDNSPVCDDYSGDCDEGEMGDALPAVDLGAGRTAKAVVLGRYHTCAILDDDTVKCWGSNGDNGRLGYGDRTNRLSPEATAVVNLGSGRTAKALATGFDHACALLDDDSLKCWGQNDQGQAGVGSSNWYVWDPAEVAFDGSSSSGGSAGAPGPAGVTGAAGASGPSGLDGAAGVAGLDGAAGVAGAPGADDNLWRVRVIGMCLMCSALLLLAYQAYLSRQRNSSLLQIRYEALKSGGCAENPALKHVDAPRLLRKAPVDIESQETTDRLPSAPVEHLSPARRIHVEEDSGSDIPDPWILPQESSTVVDIEALEPNPQGQIPWVTKLTENPMNVDGTTPDVEIRYEALKSGGYAEDPASEHVDAPRLLRKAPESEDDGGDLTDTQPEAPCSPGSSARTGRSMRSPESPKERTKLSFVRSPRRVW